MKKLVSIISSPFLFFSVIAIAADENLESHSIQENTFKEIPQLDSRLLNPPTLSQTDLDLSPLTFKPNKSSFLAVGFSWLIPGLGHAYLGDYRTAVSLIGSSTLFGLSSRLDFKPIYQDANNQLIQNTWLYGVYAAYRDVRAYNGSGGNYCYDMPTESLADLAYAPFQWSVLKKGEVWGGFLGALTVGATLQYLFFSKLADCHIDLSSKAIFPLIAFPVGIGEEAFFRGYLQSAISELFNPAWGIGLSSLLFAVAHIPNASEMFSLERKMYYSVSLPFIASFGAYFGWLAYKNCSLKEGVALHAWYDFAIFLASYSLTQSAAILKPSFAVSIPF